MKCWKTTDWHSTKIKDHTRCFNEINWFTTCNMWFVCLSHSRLIAHVKEDAKCVAYEMPGSVLVDLAVGGSNPGQCQSACVHSLCCGSFQITETWCGSLFPSDSQLLPFLLHGKTGGGGGISRVGEQHDGEKPAFLGCIALNSTILWVCVYVCCFFLGGGLWLIPKKLLVWHK